MAQPTQTLTFTLDLSDETEGRATTLRDELVTAAEHGEGITITTAGATFTVDVHAVGALITRKPREQS